MSAISIACQSLVLIVLGWPGTPPPAAAPPQLIEVHAVKIDRSATAYDVPTCSRTTAFGRRGIGGHRLCDAPVRHSAMPRRRNNGAVAYRAAGQRRHYLYWQNTAPWHYADPGAAAYDPGATPPNCRTSLAASQTDAQPGAIGGNPVGEPLDDACIASALEHAPDGHAVRWQPMAGPNPPWQVTPRTTWRTEDGRYCREFASTATIGGQRRSVYGHACRQADGAWEIVS